MIKFLRLATFALSLTTTIVNAGVTYWPDNEQWIPVDDGTSGIYTDAVDDISNNGHENLDYVGGLAPNGTNYSAVYMRQWDAVDAGSTNDFLAFRFRLDKPKQKMTGAYQVFFETDGDAGVNWAFELRTTDLDTEATLELGWATGTNRSGVVFGTDIDSWINTANDHYRYAGYVHDGSDFGGDSDIFLDIAIPWNELTPRTGLTSTNDPFRILISSSQSSGQIDDGDIANNPSGGDITFAETYSATIPEPGTLILAALVGLGALTIRNVLGMHR